MSTAGNGLHSTEETRALLGTMCADLAWHGRERRKRHSEERKRGQRGPHLTLRRVRRDDARYGTSAPVKDGGARMLRLLAGGRPHGR